MHVSIQPQRPVPDLCFSTQGFQIFSDGNEYVQHVYRMSHVLNVFSPTEAVLVVLLETFTFSMAGKPIFWNLAGVQYPSAGPTSFKASMTLKVGLVEKS